MLNGIFTYKKAFRLSHDSFLFQQPLLEDHTKKDNKNGNPMIKGGAPLKEWFQK